MAETILIVDGEPVEVSAVRRALGDGRFEYEHARTGRQAREILQTRHADVDAVLLDWMLPDMKGVDLLRWIKEQPELTDVEVVVQSARIGPDKIRAGIDNGAYYYLTKPFAEAQLQAIVQAAVESRRLKRSLVEKVNQANDVLRLLSNGTFLVRTVREAEALAVRLAASCDDPDKGVGLFELLVNAVEHGNLGITYEDKTRLLAEGTLEREIRRRLALPENRHKRVEVTLARDVDRLRLRIRDCGNGFDFRRFQKVEPERLFDSHGRGILVAGNLLDLEFVDPGNQVLVSIPFGC